MKVHVVLIKPDGAVGMYDLLQWIKKGKMRGVPDPEAACGTSIRIFADGVLGEVADDDLADARRHGEVTVHGTREVSV